MSQLAALEQRLGTAPRTVDWSLPKPAWWVKKDVLLGQWTHREAVIRDGRLVLADVYLANHALFLAGDQQDAPCSIVYGFDALLHRHPTWLEACGKRLNRMHAAKPGKASEMSPWLRRVQDEVRDEMARPIHRRLPPELTRGPVVYYSSAMLFRAHLPNGNLGSDIRLLPFLVHPDLGFALQVPFEFWPV